MIRFACPHCQKKLAIKDESAGKKARCTGCKEIVVVPGAPAAAPKAAPPQPSVEELEAAAAAALSDEPPPVEEKKDPQFIEFECPMCGEALKLDAELAGKKSSCPECRRIIKVPELVKQVKKDWRNANKPGLPSGARRDEQPAPEGAWGSAGATTVSRSALEEAGAIPETREPWTLQQKIRRGVLAAVGLLVVLGGGWWFWSYLSAGRERRLYDDAVTFADSEQAAGLVKREGQAALHALAGEYQLRTRTADTARKAAEQLNRAAELAQDESETGSSHAARLAVLADVAVLQVDLGGSQEEVDKGWRVTWENAHKAVANALNAIDDPDARREAFRLAARRMHERGQPDRARDLAAQVFADADRAAEAQLLADIVAAGRKNDWAAPRKQMEDLKGTEKGSALVALVDAAGDARNRDEADKAFKEAEAERVTSFWVLLRLTEAGARAGLDEARLKAVAAGIGEPELKGRAELAILSMQFGKKVVEESALDAVGPKDGLAPLLARAALVRANTRLDSSWPGRAEKWEKAPKAFGSIGSALGLQREP
jgi:hypothetical protein